MGVALWRQMPAEEIAPASTPTAQFRHCITVFGEQRAPWRDKVAHAIEDAIALELASWDESQQQHFLAVPVAIRTEKIDAAG